MTAILSKFRKIALVTCLGLAACSGFTQAHDLGVEGTVFEPIEEDFRLTLMRLVARQDWSISQQEMLDSAKDYTKNIPPYYLPRAEKTQTIWKDVGIVTSEDIYLPWVDWQNGSVFQPDRKLAVPAGTYLNPIAKLPAAGIERLFIFDATDPDQLANAKELMAKNIPQLSFMIIAGDLGPISEEMKRPVYHAIPTMFEKFHVQTVPSMIGFGKGPHQGHMAITEFTLPVSPEQIQNAWYGLPYDGYSPSSIADVVPVEKNEQPVVSSIPENQQASQPTASNMTEGEH